MTAIHDPEVVTWLQWFLKENEGFLFVCFCGCYNAW